MFEKIKFGLIIGIALLMLFAMVPVQDIAGYVKYAFYSNDELKINISLPDPEISVLSADPSNKLVIKAEVKNALGLPVPKAHVTFLANGASGGSIGEVYPSNGRTDKNGEFLASYIPPVLAPEKFKNGNISVTLTASASKSGASSSLNVSLARTPVVFIHGYKETGEIFDNMKEYLASKGFESSALNYKSESGIIAASKELNIFLQQQKKLYRAKGWQVSKFDIITHSMGGLVARYYSCSEDYISNDDIRKIIFISVPQRGSHWASIGMQYYDDQGIKDLIPDNALLTKTFPSMLNKGLNSTIQVGSLIGQYDEVVSLESASLEEWNIKTDVFSIGENNFTLDNILNGYIMEAANHKSILSNNKVFKEIENMLNTDLPSPTVRK